MTIDIWSDFACPFCYIGETRLKKALEHAGIKGKTEVRYRNFQLNPQAVSHPDKDIHALIAHKYQITYQEAKSNNDRITEEAKKCGLHFDFDKVKSNNTRMAHELTRYAAEHGKEDEMAQALFSAYFEKGVDIGIKENLLDLSQQVGFNKDMVEVILDEGTYTDFVLRDQETAMSLGVSSVPYFVINEAYSISGAQSQSYFNQAIKDILSKEQ